MADLSESSAGGVLQLMETLLEVVVEEFTEYAVELPQRRYLTHGQTAADCDQLTVSLIQLYRGEPGVPENEPSNCHSRISAVIEVELLRKVPSIGGSRANMVKQEALDASGRVHVTDATLLLTSLCRLVPPRYFFAQTGFFGDVTTGETQGDYSGPKLTITVAVG